jgi:hypothetical protein
VLRVVVCEEGREPLPAVDVEGDFVVGSGADARIRLPEGGGRAEVRAADGARELVLGRYRVTIAVAPAGVKASPPQRTESLARELVRAMLGADAAPALVIEGGKLAGARRVLAPPESVLVIGRGDEAGWIVDDGDLSRAHAEIHRGWDGVSVKDLGSKNGTRVDGTRVEEAELHDGARLAFGKLVMRYSDPAEQHLQAPPATRSTSPIFYVACAICVLALAGLVWVLTS